MEPGTLNDPIFEGQKLAQLTISFEHVSVRVNHRETSSHNVFLVIHRRYSRGINSLSHLLFYYCIINLVKTT